VRPGDLVRLDVVNSVDGCWARIARTVSLGRPSAQMAKLYERMRQAQEEQVARLAPGVIPSDLDDVVRSRLPIGIWVVQYSGCALGSPSCRLWGDDELGRPWIVRGEHRALAAGMVVCLSLAAGPGLSIADTVAASEQGGEYLAVYPRELLVVE
jgi:Xaa-Pro aminopeptidase